MWRTAPACDPQLTRQRIDPRRRVGEQEPQSNFDEYFASNMYPVVWIGEPGRLDARLVAQSGTFVLPGRLQEPVDELLESQYASCEPILIKFHLPLEIREAGMRHLYRMNMTFATLFADLEGLARASAVEMETFWPGLAGQPRTQSEEVY